MYANARIAELILPFNIACCVAAEPSEGDNFLDMAAILPQLSHNLPTSTSSSALQDPNMFAPIPCDAALAIEGKVEGKEEEEEEEEDAGTLPKSLCSAFHPAVE